MTNEEQINRLERIAKKVTHYGIVTGAALGVIASYVTKDANYLFYGIVAGTAATTFTLGVSIAIYNEKERSRREGK